MPSCLIIQSNVVYSELVSLRCKQIRIPYGEVTQLAILESAYCLDNSFYTSYKQIYLTLGQILVFTDLLLVLTIVEEQNKNRDWTSPSVRGRLVKNNETAVDRLVRSRKFYCQTLGYTTESFRVWLLSWKQSLYTINKFKYYMTTSEYGNISNVLTWLVT